MHLRNQFLILSTLLSLRTAAQLVVPTIEQVEAGRVPGFLGAEYTRNDGDAFTGTFCVCGDALEKRGPPTANEAIMGHVWIIMYYNVHTNHTFILSSICGVYPLNKAWGERECFVQERRDGIELLRPRPDDEFFVSRNGRGRLQRSYQRLHQTPRHKTDPRETDDVFMFHFGDRFTPMRFDTMLVGSYIQFNGQRRSLGKKFLEDDDMREDAFLDWGKWHYRDKLVHDTCQQTCQRFLGIDVGLMKPVLKEEVMHTISEGTPEDVERPKEKEVEEDEEKKEAEEKKKWKEKERPKWKEISQGSPEDVERPEEKGEKKRKGDEKKRPQLTKISKGSPEDVERPKEKKEKIEKRKEKEEKEEKKRKEKEKEKERSRLKETSEGKAPNYRTDCVQLGIWGLKDMCDSC